MHRMEAAFPACMKPVCTCYRIHLWQMHNAALHVMLLALHMLYMQLQQVPPTTVLG